MQNVDNCFFHADEAGRDDIVDIPYVIDENNQDRYPLTEPWEPPAMIRSLIRTIRSWDLPKGTEKSLTSKLEKALYLLGSGNENGAIRKLTDFMAQVEASRDKKLTQEQANYMTSEAQKNHRPHQRMNLLILHTRALLDTFTTKTNFRGKL